MASRGYTIWPGRVKTALSAFCLTAMPALLAGVADPVLEKESPRSNVLRIEPAHPPPQVLIPGQPEPEAAIEPTPLPPDLPVQLEPAREPAPAAVTVTPPAAAPAAGPDETLLWEMLNRQNYAGVLNEVDRLRVSHPAWTPPAQLMDLARDGLREQRIRSAMAGGDHGALARLEAADPGAFACANPDRAWSVAEAFHQLGDRERLIAVLERLIPACRPEDRFVTLQKSRAWLTTDDWETLAARESAASRPTELDSQFQRLLYDHRAAQLFAAQEASDPERVAELLARLAADIRQFRDTDAAMLAGWHFLRAQDIAGAREWFDLARQWDPGRDDAVHGLALCALQERRFTDAQGLADELPREFPGRADIARDAAIGLAQAAQEQGDPARALGHLEDAEQAGLALPRYARLLAGWASLQGGDAAGAAHKFRTLYEEQPDQESADGLVNSLVSAGRAEELDSLATSEPLAGVARTHRAREMFNTKRFLAARALSADQYGDLGSAGAPRAGAYGMWRDKSGTPGLSELQDTILGPEIAWPLGARSELRLRLDQHNLDSGGLSVESRQYLARGLLEGALGLDPVAPGFADLQDAGAAGLLIDGTHGHVSGWEPTLSWRHESRFVLEAALGARLSGGLAAPQPIGRLSVQGHEQWGNYTVAGFIRPIRESILSYTGLRLDEFILPTAFDGDTWGAVRGRGAEFSALGALPGDLSVNGRITLEHIDGKHVHDNTHQALTISLGRNFRLTGFDYFVPGINFSYDHYEHNLGQFTPGHGGYFSPQNYWQAKAALDFQTGENRAAILKGHLDGGRAFKREGATPMVPLEGFTDLGTFPGNRTWGWAYSVELSGAARVTDHIQVGAHFSRRESPQYDETAGMLFVRVLFEPRKSVLSFDLPSQVANEVR